MKTRWTVTLDREFQGWKTWSWPTSELAQSFLNLYGPGKIVKETSTDGVTWKAIKT